MSYEPTNWKAGDTVTSAKLNKMEQGISNNGPLVVHITENSENGTTSKTMDKTWLQICEAAPNVCFVEEYSDGNYSLKTYWLEEIRGTYGTTAGLSGTIQLFPPSITLLDLSNQNTFKFETSQPYNESENPVWAIQGVPIGDGSNLSTL